MRIETPPPRGRPTISAVLPALDEEGNLAGVVADLSAVLEEVASGFEIIIVDDGSTDRTGEIAAELGRRDARVRLVRHGTNRGYGAALRSGMTEARLDWVFYADADGQIPMGAVRELVALCCIPSTGSGSDGGEISGAGSAEGTDAVFGFRTHRADPWFRRLYAWLWNAAARILLGIRVRDLNCAFKLVRRTLLADADLRVTGAAINAEILLALGERGARIREIGVPHRPRSRGRQTGGRPRVILRALADLGVLWIVRRLGRRGGRPRGIMGE